MYDCRQLEDVSSVESVQMVTEILSQVFIRCCHLNLPSLRSVVPQAFGALELKGPLYMTPYIMLTWRAFSFQYFHATNFTSNISVDSDLITGSSLYNSNYGLSVLNSVIWASYITIKSSGVRTEPRWTSTPKICDNCQLLSCFSCPWSVHASVAPATRWFKSRHTTYLLSFSMLMKVM